MRQKQLVLRKMAELQNLLNGAKALISTNRPKEEMQVQLERIEAKMQDIEVLVNRENEQWN